MLRASGRADSKGDFKGGLYRTNDGGKTWKDLLLQGDFDGLGPSALCGEILVFLPMNPKIIFVGCETRGLFRSDDGGDTWALLGQKGHRITAIHANPYFQNQFGQTVIETVTCPDHFMSLLGRGDPVFTTQSNEASIHVSHDNGKTFQEASSRSDLGYYNILSLRCSPHHWLYGTSHGLLYTFSQGRDSYLYSTSLEVDSLRPFTALAGSIAGTQLCSRKFVSAINPAKPGHLSRCDLGGDVWAWAISQQDEASATIAIAAANPTESSSGDSWWILESKGLFRTDDSGVTKYQVIKP